MGGACSQKLKPRRGLHSSSGRLCVGTGTPLLYLKAESASKNWAHLAFDFWVSLTTSAGWVKSGWVVSPKRSRHRRDCVDRPQYAVNNPWLPSSLRNIPAGQPGNNAGRCHEDETPKEPPGTEKFSTEAQP